MIGTAKAKPAKGTAKRQKAAGQRAQAKADKLVYAAVDARDGLRCRICLEYAGLDIHRHHLVYRSAGGLTTTANILSLCPNCHVVGVHGGRLKASGNADERGRYGRLCGVRVEQLNTGDVWQA
jgi:hypothetical protein